MMMPAYRCSRRLLFALCWLAALILLGCGSDAEIRSYTVDKEPTSPGASEPAAPIGEPTDRMMGAIVPVSDQTWYFKVVGPIAAMDKNADKITEFFQSIRVEKGAAKPEWKTPEGWEEKTASGMRAATLLVPAEGKPLDLSVIPIPTSGAPDELLDNVNRWLGQLQLPQVDERGLAAITKESQAGERAMTTVDVRGRFSAGNMAAPFAGGGPFSGGASRPPANAPVGADVSPQGTQQASPAELPPGHPPIDSPAPVAKASAATFDFKAPESWQEQPPSGFRKVDFDIQEGDRSAEVSVIDLPASAPNVGNALENINRWRGEIGLTPMKEEQVAGVVQKIEVSGTPSEYVELMPDAANPAEAQVDKATIAASVPAGNVIWFFKLRGDRDLVAAERDNFKSFLESVRFKSADGAGDGNNQ